MANLDKSSAQKVELLAKGRVFLAERIETYKGKNYTHWKMTVTYNGYDLVIDMGEMKKKYMLESKKTGKKFPHFVEMLLYFIIKIARDNMKRFINWMIFIGKMFASTGKALKEQVPAYEELKQANESDSYISEEVINAK